MIEEDIGAVWVTSIFLSSTTALKYEASSVYHCFIPSSLKTQTLPVVSLLFLNRKLAIFKTKYRYIILSIQMKSTFVLRSVFSRIYRPTSSVNFILKFLCQILKQKKWNFFNLRSVSRGCTFASIHKNVIVNWMTMYINKHNYVFLFLLTLI